MTEYEELIGIFTSTTDPKKMEKLFEELLTPHERDSVVLRWHLMKELYQGVSQRTIAANHNISLCKITRGSKILKAQDSYCRKLLSDKFDDHLAL